MSDLSENRISEEELADVSGGISRGRGGAYSVRSITPCWVEVTSPSLNCRYGPSTSSPIAKKYEKGHRLKVDGISDDGKWYRLLIYDSKNTTCYGYVSKDYTKLV